MAAMMMAKRLPMCTGCSDLFQFWRVMVCSLWLAICSFNGCRGALKVFNFKNNLNNWLSCRKWSQFSSQLLLQFYSPFRCGQTRISAWQWHCGIYRIGTKRQWIEGSKNSWGKTKEKITKKICWIFGGFHLSFDLFPRHSGQSIKI